VVLLTKVDVELQVAQVAPVVDYLVLFYNVFSCLQKYSVTMDCQHTHMEEYMILFE
jgi:hypothetical protein